MQSERPTTILEAASDREEMARLRSFAYGGNTTFEFRLRRYSSVLSIHMLLRKTIERYFGG